MFTKQDILSVHDLVLHLLIYFAIKLFVIHFHMFLTYVVTKLEPQAMHHKVLQYDVQHILIAYNFLPELNGTTNRCDKL